MQKKKTLCHRTNLHLFIFSSSQRNALQITLPFMHLAFIFWANMRSGGEIRREFSPAGKVRGSSGAGFKCDSLTPCFQRSLMNANTPHGTNVAAHGGDGVGTSPAGLLQLECLCGSVCYMDALTKHVFHNSLSNARAHTHDLMKGNKTEHEKWSYIHAHICMLRNCIHRAHYHES